MLKRRIHSEQDRRAGASVRGLGCFLPHLSHCTRVLVLTLDVNHRFGFLRVLSAQWARATKCTKILISIIKHCLLLLLVVLVSNQR